MEKIEERLTKIEKQIGNHLTEVVGRLTEIETNQKWIKWFILAIAVALISSLFK